MGGGDISLDCQDFLGVVGATGSFLGVMSLCFGFLGSVEYSPSSYLLDFFLFLSDLCVGDLSYTNETVFFSLFRTIFSEHHRTGTVNHKMPYNRVW